MNKCSCDGCVLDVWKEYDKCVLHCPKGDYQNDRRNKLLTEFNRQFILYILGTFRDSMLDSEREIYHFFANDNEDDQVKTFYNFLSNQDSEDYTRVKTLLLDITFIPTSIVFPRSDTRDYFDYSKVLKLFKKIHFNYCEFSDTHLNLNDAEVFFQDCIFHDYWSLYDYNILQNVNDIIYQSCVFHKKVSMSTYTEYNKTFNILSAPQFDYTCIFHDEIKLDGIIIEQPFFNSEDSNYVPEDAKIKCIELLNCTVEQKFVLNDFKIIKFNSEKTIFKSKFEFKNNKIEKFILDDSNFKKLVDCYKTEFTEFKIYKSIFEDFVGFEECKFGKSDVNKKDIALFEYATFLDFTNFRNTKFLSGLNMGKINLKEYPNFLGSFVEFQNTNRETFRIIKHSYDKIGNHIEANKYFSLEMKKHKVELKSQSSKGHFQEKFIFWVNEKISNFGQSFLKPIVLIILLTIIYGVIIYGNEEHWLMSIYPKGSEYLNSIVHWLNYPLKELRPLEKILKKDYEFVSLIFNVIFSVLIWQTIVAVKRYTKR